MASKTPSPLEMVQRYLRDHQWKAEAMPKEHAFKEERETKYGIVTYYFQIEPELDQFLFYISPEIRLIKEQLLPVAEFVVRANFGMRIGNFELDMKEGKVSFRSGLNFKGQGLSTALIDGAVQPALKAFEEFYPSLEKVFAGIMSPLEAINEAEYGI